MTRESRLQPMERPITPEGWIEGGAKDRLAHMGARVVTAGIEALDWAYHLAEDQDIPAIHQDDVQLAGPDRQSL